MRREPPMVPPIRCGVFTMREGVAAGWTARALDHAVSTGRLLRLRPGVYAIASSPNLNPHLQRRHQLHRDTVAALLSNPCAVASHASAAVLHDLPIWFTPTEPCLTVPPRYVGDIAGAHLHRCRSYETHLLDLDLPVHTIERTTIDVGREHGVLSSLVVADAALHRGDTTVAALRATLRDCRGWPGVRAAREAIDFADSRSESPLETASRYRLRGLVPAPDLQAEIYDRDGRFLGRSDFLWDELGVVGEADGMAKYVEEDALPLTKEKVRQGEFEDTGLVVVRWGAADLRPIERLVARLERGFARAKLRREPRGWQIRRTPRSTDPALHL